MTTVLALVALVISVYHYYIDHGFTLGSSTTASPSDTPGNSKK